MFLSPLYAKKTPHVIAKIETLTLGADVTPGDKEVIGLLGGADTNGEVNIKDGTVIQKAVAKTLSLDDTQKLLADVNNDVTVNIKDATAIQELK